MAALRKARGKPGPVASHILTVIPAPLGEGKR